MKPTHSDSKVGTVTDFLEDDNGENLPIRVIYDYHYYYSPFGREIMVTGYDIEYVGKIDRVSLDNIATDLIKGNEFNEVYFNI